MTLDVFTQRLKDGVAALAMRHPAPQYPVGMADWPMIATAADTHTAGCAGMCQTCQVRSSLLNYDRG